jgi:hypothetical protein
MVSFGVATVRDNVWFLAALHTLPAFQGQGIGREVLGRCLKTAPAENAVLSVMSEAFSPVSNALYARQGMHPWVPMVYLDGPAAGFTEPADLAAEALALDSPRLPELDRIDRDVLGIARPLDHRHWLSQTGLVGWLFARDGHPVAYAYVSTMGGIGPVAVRAPDDVPDVLAASIVAAREAGSATASLAMPGHCHPGLAYLLGRGFRYGPIINLLLASRPFGHLDRYFHSAWDALF